MSGFGQWYEETKANEGADLEAADGSSSSWFGMDSEQMLPLFNSAGMPESMQNFSFDSMKQSMEAQMPKKILGMGYQQRFKVRTFFAYCLEETEGKYSTCLQSHFSSTTKSLCCCAFLLNDKKGVLCIIIFISTVFCFSLLCGITNDSIKATKICFKLYLWKFDIHG